MQSLLGTNHPAGDKCSGIVWRQRQLGEAENSEKQAVTKGLETK